MTIATEIIETDNAIQAIINTLKSEECTIKCWIEVVKLLEAAIMELDDETERTLENASR